MKIVMVNGQNHKGSTYHVGKLLIDSVASPKEVTEFFLPRDLNHFCVGCFACIEDETKCPCYAEKTAIMQEVEHADLLVFTTPNYCMAPSAPMKAFIDLTFTYWLAHKPRGCMYGKRAVVISTAAGAGASDAIKPVARTLFYWGVPAIKRYGVSVHAAKWEDVSAAQKAKIEKDMQRMAKSLSGGKKPTIGLRTRFFFWVFSGMQKAGMGSSPTEKLYWENQGWLAKERPWHSRHS